MFFTFFEQRSLRAQISQCGGHRFVFSMDTFFLQCIVGSLFVFPVAQKKCALVATVPLTSNVLRKYSNNCESFLR